MVLRYLSSLITASSFFCYPTQSDCKMFQMIQKKKSEKQDKELNDEKIKSGKFKYLKILNG